MVVDTRDGLQSEDGAVRTPRITSPGWNGTTASRAGKDFVLTEVTWRLPRKDRAPLSLYAKDYRGPHETLTTLERRDWRAHYRPLLREVTKLEAGPARVGDRAAWRVFAEGRGEGDLRLRIDERYVPADGHLLVLTAVGCPDDLQDLATPVATWVEGVVFHPSPPMDGGSR